MNWKQISTDTADRLKAVKARPRLTLHSCCAPCSSYSLEYLSPDFAIDLFYYNPCIDPKDEYEHRLSEQRRFVSERYNESITVTEGEYNPERFQALAAPFASMPEGGKRCEICIRDRLEATAKRAAETGADCFSTTLTVSPHKNADMINNLCLELEGVYGVTALPLDLKKNDGYKRSIAISRAYNLYRQSYCGCIYSRKTGE